MVPNKTWQGKKSQRRKNHYGNQEESCKEGRQEEKALSESIPLESKFGKAS